MTIQLEISKEFWGELQKILDSYQQQNKENLEALAARLEGNKHLSKNAARKMLCVGNERLLKLIKSGEIPIQPTGKIRQSDLTAWQARQASKQ